MIEQERNKYRRMWERESYRERSPGLRHLRQALNWLRPSAGASFTDWGCGTGAALERLAELGFAARGVDIADNCYTGALPFVEACLWDLPADLEATDYGFCADVMEHIPPAYVQPVLDGIAARTHAACYFQIALFDDDMGKAIGETLHLSVFPHEWWRRRVLRAFRRAEFSVLRGKHLLVVGRR